MVLLFCSLLRKPVDHLPSSFFIAAHHGRDLPDEGINIVLLGLSLTGQAEQQKSKNEWSSHKL